MDTSLEKWRRELFDNDNCSDKLLLAGRRAISKSGNYESAQLKVADTLSKFPQAKTAYLLEGPRSTQFKAEHAASALGTAEV